MSSTSVLRAPMSPVVRHYRAYFAPVNRVTGAPAVFDPARDCLLDLNTPPAPWIDGGWIANVKRTQTTKTNTLRAGSKGSASVQFRSELDARLEFDFRQWGKLQMALCAGSEGLNVLAANSGGGASPSGGPAFPAVPVLTGSTAAEIVIGSSAASGFQPGDVIAVDVDYTGQTGYVGTGITAGYVGSSTGLTADYVRRVTFNVARIAEVTAVSLKLSQPLMGGVPESNAKLQKVVAFADREGGSFMPEWSALLVATGENGARACFYYPRLQPAAPGSESVIPVADPLTTVALHASFIALPFADAMDGQSALCWRSYFPAANAAVY